MVDPRAARSSEVLRAAVLRLASQRPIERVSTADIAREAGVTRATVYNHARSPETLLALALSRELDGIRTRFLDEVSARPDQIESIWRAREGDLLEHVDAHRALYTLGLRESDLAHGSAVADLLARHIQRSLESWDAVMRPGAGPQERLRATMTSAFLARGTVGAIAAWLADESTVPLDTVRDHIVAMIPDWLLTR